MIKIINDLFKRTSIGNGVRRTWAKFLFGHSQRHKKRKFISLRSLLSSEEFQLSHYDLPIVLGKGDDDSVSLFDLHKRPVKIIYRKANTGETVLVDSMITSLLYEKSSKEVIIIMIDPKEQLCYGSLLHELSRQQDYANSSDRGMELLSLLLEERDEQARLLVESNRRNMDEYNKLQS